jgi:hypothetical protein
VIVFSQRGVINIAGSIALGSAKEQEDMPHGTIRVAWMKHSQRDSHVSIESIEFCHPNWLVMR